MALYMQVANCYRHQFYLHARLDLLEGRLKVPCKETATKLVALIAQAETGDLEPESPPLYLYTQWCQLLLDSAVDGSLEPVVHLHKDIRVRDKSKCFLFVIFECTRYCDHIKAHIL